MWSIGCRSFQKHPFIIHWPVSSLQYTCAPKQRAFARSPFKFVCFGLQRLGVGWGAGGERSVMLP
jgi:hypothetical protein